MSKTVLPEAARRYALARIRRAFALATGAAGVLLVVAMPAQAASYSPNIPFPTSCGGCVMNAGNALTDGVWKLNMQGDGNLVLRNSAGTACFATNTNGHTNAHVSYQSDGNFVVYSTGGTALWASGTVGLTGSSYNVSISHGDFYVATKLIHGPC